MYAQTICFIFALLLLFLLSPLSLSLLLLVSLFLFLLALMVLLLLPQVLGDGEKFIAVAAIVIHSGYNKNTQDNDFSLLKLAAPAPISSKVGIACLPQDLIQTFAGSALKISGWGTTSSGGQQSSSLLYANVMGMNNAACASSYGSSVITGNMMCATADNYSKDTCQGDSGGKISRDLNNTAMWCQIWSELVVFGCTQLYLYNARLYFI